MTSEYHISLSGELTVVDTDKHLTYCSLFKELGHGVLYYYWAPSNYKGADVYRSIGWAIGDDLNTSALMAQTKYHTKEQIPLEIQAMELLYGR